MVGDEAVVPAQIPEPEPPQIQLQLLVQPLPTGLPEPRSMSALREQNKET